MIFSLLDFNPASLGPDYSPVRPDDSGPPSKLSGTGLKRKMFFFFGTKKEVINLMQS